MGIRILITSILLGLFFSCSKNNYVELNSTLTLNQYEVQNFRIDRGTIYINNKFIFYDHMIAEDRLRIMDKLYLIKTPLKISHGDGQLRISSNEEVLSLKLNYNSN